MECANSAATPITANPIMSDSTSSKQQLSFKADTSELAALGAFLQEHCHEHPQVILIELAVTEVVVNALKHGAAKWCHVSVEKTSKSFKIEVADDGQAFDMSQATPKPMGELREHGYGLGIIHKVTEQLEYSHDDGWGRLTLSFARC